MPPAAAYSAAPAQWPTSNLDVFDKQWVTGMVGPNFAGYARIFQPPPTKITTAGKPDTHQPGPNDTHPTRSMTGQQSVSGLPR